VTTRWWVVLLVAAGGAGCARHAASQVTAGALSSIEKGVKEEKPPGEARPVELGAQRAVRAGVAQLSSPEQLAELRRVAEEAAAAAVTRALQAALAGSPSPVERLATEAAEGFRESLSTGLAGDLGEAGPLATGVSGAVRLAAASATDGAVGRIFPGCAPEDATCLDRRIAALSQQAAVGFGAGLKKSLGLAALVLAFIAGAVVTLMVMLVIQLEVKRREPQPEVARAH
jgi:hypothetical protein